MTTAPFDRVARSAHPRLLLLVLLGAAVGLLGTLLAVVGPSVGLPVGGPAARIAILGALVFLAGASGYLAFTVFDRGFD